MKRIKQMDNTKGQFLSDFSDNELEISWEAIQNNLNFFKQKLRSGTKLMLMVKASAYGHSSSEIVSRIQAENLAQYLGVATLAEGIELREKGIEMPIMVQTVSPEHWNILVEHCLEPTIYSFEILDSFHSFLLKSDALKENGYPIHIKLNTGMNRLGFNLNDLPALKTRIIAQEAFRVSSIMSHLSSAGDPTAKDFTLQQIADFKSMSDELSTDLQEKPIRHILNTNGIMYYPSDQMDMVRLGIGLYGGMKIGDSNQKLKPISKLISRVIQVRKVSPGEFISYSRSGHVDRESNIGVISLGYADGFPRRLGNGNWEVEIEGKLYPTIGNICMDLCMVNLGNDKVPPRSKVIIFGGIKSIFEYAAALETITYEASTNLDNRIKRTLI